MVKHLTPIGVTFAIALSATSLVLSASSAKAACTLIKADPKCWGDTCRMICAPWARPLGSAHRETGVRSPNISHVYCGPCVLHRRTCTYDIGGSLIRKRVPC
jgi:hypothetical protein